MGQEVSVCSVGRGGVVKPVDDYVEELRAAGVDPGSVKARILRLRHQLWEGCGNPECSNPNSVKPLGPGDALLHALDLLNRDQHGIAIDPPHVATEEDVKKMRLLKEAPERQAEPNPVLDPISEDYANATGLKVTYEKVFKAFTSSRKAAVSPAVAKNLVIALYRTDAADAISANTNRSAVMLELGRVYMDGVLAAPNSSQAIQWFVRGGLPLPEAAEKVMSSLGKLFEDGQMDAADQLATMYRRGDGVAIDYRKCVDWLLSRWELEHPFTEQGPGWMPDDPLDPSGKTHEQKRTEARQRHLSDGRKQVELRVFKWFLQDSLRSDKEKAQGARKRRLSNAQASREAQRMLSYMYAYGVGVEKDDRKAVQHLHELTDSSVRLILPPDEVERVRLDAEAYITQRETLREEAERARANMAREKEERKEKLVQQSVWSIDDDLARRGIYDEAVGGDDPFEEENVEAVESKAVEEMGKSDKVVVDDHEFQVDMRVHAKALNIALTHIEGIGRDVDATEGTRWMYPKSVAQRWVFEKFLRAAKSGKPEAPFNLAQLYLQYPTFISYQVAAGRGKSYFQEEAARWFLRGAEDGHVPSQLQLATCYMEWIGVPIDFKEAKRWYMTAGKSKEFVRKKIDKKLSTMRSHYLRVFKSLDTGKTGELTLDQFREFYILCLQAKGMARKQAVERTTSKYQGNQMYEAVFQSLEIDKNRGIEFDELWAHSPAQIFPRTGENVMNAKRFFSKRSSAQQGSNKSAAVEHITPGGPDEVSEEEEEVQKVERPGRTKSGTLYLPTASALAKYSAPGGRKKQKSPTKKTSIKPWQ